jgi:hypothetical protein
MSDSDRHSYRKNTELRLNLRKSENGALIVGVIPDLLLTQIFGSVTFK